MAWQYRVIWMKYEEVTIKGKTQTDWIVEFNDGITRVGWDDISCCRKQ
jgi:hypothetical protein